jgi:redox-sensitive bicupin YhaK (pirin superfamily)
MIKIRKSVDRGRTRIDWLDSYHTFSFGGYSDRNFLKFHNLRVINDDKVKAGCGFGTHPHKDMEIISYVIDGQLEHKDSMSNGSVIKAGDVQRMSAGKGVTHSEFNPSEDEDVHFLQIWFFPINNQSEPSYQQKFFSPEEKKGKLKLVVSQNGDEGSLTVDQDVNMYAATLKQNESLEYTVKQGRAIWIHIAKGSVNINGYVLEAGDGLSVDEPCLLNINNGEDAEIVLFDLLNTEAVLNN